MPVKLVMNAGKGEPGLTRLVNVSVTAKFSTRIIAISTTRPRLALRPLVSMSTKTRGCSTTLMLIHSSKSMV
jgi:hypothetical protein